MSSDEESVVVVVGVVVADANVVVGVVDVADVDVVDVVVAPHLDVVPPPTSPPHAPLLLRHLLFGNKCCSSSRILCRP